MAKIIKIKCNGVGRHLNEIDIEKYLQPTTVIRRLQNSPSNTIPERLVLPCQVCTEGKVVITGKMIEELQ